MTSTGQDFSLHRGRHRVLVFVVKDDSGGAVDPTDVDATWILSRGVGHDAILTKTPGSGLTVDEDPTDSTLRVTVDLENDDTVNLDAGRYYHELGITDSPGNRYVVAEGTLILRETTIPPEAA